MATAPLVIAAALAAAQPGPPAPSLPSLVQRADDELDQARITNARCDDRGRDAAIGQLEQIAGSADLAWRDARGRRASRDDIARAELERRLVFERLEDARKLPPLCATGRTDR